MNRKINSKILDTGRVFAVGQSPYRIDPNSRKRYPCRPLFQNRAWTPKTFPREQQTARIWGGFRYSYRKVFRLNPLKIKYFPPFQFFHQRNLPQKETFKMMFVEKCQPGIRSNS